MFFRSRDRQTAPSKPQRVTWTTPDGEYYAISAQALKAEHTLIAGSTGCGKSTFLRSVLQAFLTEYTPADAELIIIDPKRTDLWRYAKLPHVRRYIDTKEDALSALSAVYEEIIARQTEARAKDEDEYSGKALFILIDELNPLINDRVLGKRIAQALEDITTLGRSAKVHLIAATQNPNRSTLPGNIADNCTCRFGLKCQTPYQSRAIVNQSGCERLPKHGVTLADLNGDIGLFKIPFVTMDEMKPLLSYWMSEECKTVH